jgi:outer membrane receptor protein involved in Fe transport
VSVTSAATIEKAEIKDLADLQSVVPSLKINTLQNSTNTNFSIRGFGNGANNPGIEPSVGVFIDGVYRSRSASTITDLPNLERVEVLKGPQSTLFGKNASAGVISIVTRAPNGEAGGNVAATVGNYGQVGLRGQVEGSLGENVFFDLSANTNTRDGYFDNLTTGSEINDRDRQAVRAQLVIAPSDETNIRLIADWDQIDENCCGVINLYQSPLEVFINSQTGARVIPNDHEALSAFGNTDPINDIENSGISAQIDREFDGFTLTSITSIRTTDSFSSIDADFSSGDYIRNDITTEIDTFTQEIRLTSDGDGNVDWMVGGYFFDESIDYKNDLPYGADFRGFVDALTAAAGAPNALAGIESAFGLPLFQAFFPSNGAVTEVADLENDAFSIFGSFDWHINDRLTATLGLNYTKDNKEAQVSQVNRDLFSGLDFVQLGAGAIFQQLVGAGVPPAVAAGQAAALSTTPANPFLALQPVQFLPPFQDYPNAIEDGKSDDDEITYNLRFAYDLSDNTNVYAGISTGFKATSWNLSRDARPVGADLAALRASGLAVNNLVRGTRFALPEEATVYEIGLKTRFEKGSLNLAIFDQEIENFQSNVFGGTGFNLTNAGAQSTKGIEFDFIYYPTESLEFTLAGTILDPEYDEFQGASGIRFNPLNGSYEGTVVDLSGQTVAGVSELSIATSLTYNFTLGNSLDSYIRADFQYDEEVATNDNIPGDLASIEFKNLNMSAGVTTENGLSFTLWARNLTDHATVTTGFPTVGGSGGIFGYRNQPRTYGVTVSKDF